MLGVEPGGPRVTCDGCGLVLRVREDRLPPKWLLDGKAPPGWLLACGSDGARTDYCKKCRAAYQP